MQSCQDVSACESGFYHASQDHGCSSKFFTYEHKLLDLTNLPGLALAKAQ